MYRIEISGEGSHHNGLKQDAENLARALIEGLRASGHDIIRAEFTAIGSGIEDLLATAPQSEEKASIGMQEQARIRKETR